MAEYLIQGETLKDIADAIRAKTGRTDKIAVTDMAKAISEITGGAAEPVLIDLTVTENGIYTPGEGIDGYSSVTVEVEGGGSYSGTCGANLTWNLDPEGKLYIRGTGAMYDYGSDAFNRDDMPWYFCKDSIKNIAIAEGVTSIGTYAFYNCTNLETITIPNSIIHIGNGVTYDCKNMTGVYINYLSSWLRINFDGNPLQEAHNLYIKGNLLTDLVAETSIPKYAFQGCSIKSLSFKYENASIGEGAFSGCQQLESVTLPSGLTNIPKTAFGFCTALHSIVIPDSVKTLRNLAFAFTPLEDVTIGSGVTLIETSVFTSKLTSLTFKVTDGWKVYDKDTDTTPIKVFASTELDDPAEAAVAFNQHLSDYWKRT